MEALPSYLLSIEMERLLVRGATVSLFSLVVVVGSEEEEEVEEEKMEAGELSFAESKGEIRRRRRRRKDQLYYCGFSLFYK